MRSTEPSLVDSFGREITDLRISITKRCNFDCFYCHNEGLGDTLGPRAPQDEEMSRDRVLRIAEVAHEFGVRNFKITGGEPMLRDDLSDIVAGISSLSGEDNLEVSLTTNGVFLDGRASELSDSGLDRVNVSMDVPTPEEFREITRGGIQRVYDGVYAAVRAGLTPTKLNMVMAEPMRPYLDDMLDYAGSVDGVELQIIEYMPELVGDQDLRVDIDEIKRELEKVADSFETRRMHNRNRYIVDGTPVEVVDPVGNKDFCANCHRLRVTHDGELKGCLNRNDGLVPANGTLDEVREAFREVTKNRVPYYGEYMVEDGDGGWRRNPEYQDKKDSEVPLVR